MFTCIVLVVATFKFIAMLGLVGGGGGGRGAAGPPGGFNNNKYLNIINIFKIMIKFH